MIGLLLALLGGCTDVPRLEIEASDAVTLVVVGDTGKNTPERDAVSAAIHEWCDAHPCDAVLIPGDLLYTAGMTHPEDPRFDAVLAPFRLTGTPLLLAMGNHDWQKTHQPRAARWMHQVAPDALPAPDYSATLGPVQLDVIDSDTVFWQHAVQARKVLAGPRTRPFRVLMTHHPYRSAGPHGDAGNYEGLGPLPIVSGARLERLYADEVCGRYDWVLTGHDHSLQLHRDCDVDFVISGSGASTTSVDTDHPTLSFGASTPGFAVLRFDSDGRSSVQFVDSEGQVLHTYRRAP